MERNRVKPDFFELWNEVHNVIEFIKYGTKIFHLAFGAFLGRLPIKAKRAARITTLSDFENDRDRTLIERDRINVFRGNLHASHNFLNHDRTYLPSFIFGMPT